MNIFILGYDRLCIVCLSFCIKTNHNGVECWTLVLVMTFRYALSSACCRPSAVGGCDATKCSQPGKGMLNVECTVPVIIRILFFSSMSLSLRVRC